ncbi:MAG: T9SS type A sorting domain-containing protein [Vicingaceae bacterium]|nr:T9SS type A sorting domain-containing protein [Vicingaceae bacterium]
MKYNLKIFLFIFAPFFLNTEGYSQTNFSKHDSIIVLDDIGDTLDNPWAGGFNSVQFSEIDVNIDGKMDLFVFDRTGHRISIFLNKGGPNQSVYTHAPFYNQSFPDLHDWVLLRDYNCDGKMDIFTYSSGGMAVYKNTSTTFLSFSLQTNLLFSDYQPDAAPNFINLYVSSSDIPAIDDIDNDGDLDILTFSITGSYVEYHKNLSIEKNGNCDSLDFQLNNKCWGFFKENLTSNSVTLFDTCSFNVNNPQKYSGGNKHAGSTLLTLDVDSNNSKDLVLADVSYSNFTLLINQDASPNLTASSIISQDSVFPSNTNSTIATDIDIFPAGFYLDINNDNIKDLVASPNCFNGCLNKDNVWMYKNIGANNKPDFSFVKNNFLQGGIIEVGEGAHPVFFDYNADGLTDIIIGNQGIYNPSSGPLLYESSLWVYENIGTANNPKFQLADTNYAGISSMNLDITNSRPTLGLAPCFGDMDGDGDDDMLLGDYNGYIHHFTNTAGPGNPAAFTLTTPEYLGIDVGNDATPILYDINKDNLIDIIIGKENGTFSYYENKGNSTIPNYIFKTDSLGKISTRRQFDFQGNSNPILIDSNGVTHLYSGCKNGRLYKFGNIDGNLTGTFSIDSSFNNIREGINSFVAIEDITNDGMLDMLVGIYNGGISFYKGDMNVNITDMPAELDNINIYPNPTHNLITIDLGTNSIKNTSIHIIDILGKTLYDGTFNNKQKVINLSNYRKGIYLIKINNKTSSRVYRVIKK